MPRGRPRVEVTPCRFCNMQFKRVEHLQRHERIHTREKPFACDCGMRFSRQDLLSRHLKLGNHDPPAEAAAVTPTQTTPIREREGYPMIAQSPQHTDQDARIPNENSGTDLPGVPTSNTVPSLVQDSVSVEPPSNLVNSASSDHPPNLSYSHGYLPHDSTTGWSLGSTYEFELLWNNSSDMTDFLPTSFFDTDYSLSDLWQADTFLPNNPVIALQGNGDDRRDLPQRHSEHPPNFSYLSTRLPPLEPDSLSSNNERLPDNELDTYRVLDGSMDSTTGLPWNISRPTYERISTAVQCLDKVLSAAFVIPSRHAISRYIEGYFRGFHEHFPFLHPATLKMDALAPELVLAMAAVGAFYRFEHSKGYGLYLGAKAIIAHRLDQRSQSLIADLAKGPPIAFNLGTGRGILTSSRGQADHNPHHSCTNLYTSQAELQTLQSLVILVAMATWADAPAARDALSMGSQLALLTREAGLSTPDEIVGQCAWVDWIRREERRRTLFVSYIVLNLSSITFDCAPLILNHEVGICLPHCNTEWVKASAAEWNYTRKTYGHTEYEFQSTVKEMLSGQEIHNREPLSALGNYALINALLQHIFFERQATTRHTLDPTIVKRFESALQVWQKSWEATQETSLDPSSPNGPLGFNSAALFRLAYLRLNANLGPCRNMFSQDPRIIAEYFTKDAAPLFTRSSHVDRAILQCIHALSIPIRVGIAFVACTQIMNGGIQHPLCTLECALLLSTWLGNVSEAVRTSGLSSLREDERKLLGMIASLIKETDRASTLETNEADEFYIRRMAATVVRLWAETFRRPHIFQTVCVVGDTLSLVADILEETLEK